jgi:2,3-diketo-5-methylthio-1-phosphopentane phosphatase
MAGPAAVVFLDFDGTITRRDATDAILDAFADRAWMEVEDAWVSGQIGSRECLEKQMALVNATPEQIDDLLDGISIDPGFPELLDSCIARSIPVHIVSDGFDYCIQRILRRPNLNLLARLTGSHIVSNGLRPVGQHWSATFVHPSTPCAHGCATCKPAVMDRLSIADALTVFVGDGLSDQYAARRADVVFAKDTLAAFCDHASIPYRPYDTLATVAEELERLLSEESSPASSVGKEFRVV